MINFHEIHFRKEFILWFKCIIPIPRDIADRFVYETPVDFFIENGVCYLSCPDGRGEPFTTSLKLRPMQEANSDFESMIRRPCYYLALFQTAAHSKDASAPCGEIMLRFLFSNGTMLRDRDLEIALTPKLIRRFREEFGCSSDEAITQALWNELMFEHNGSRYYIFDGDVVPLENDLPNNEEGQRKFAFSIVGSKHRLSITTSSVGSKQILLAYAWRRCNTLNSPLCTPSIFKGAWHCKQQRHLVKEIQDNLFEERYKTEDSYFRNWNEYMDLYLDFILESAREAGCYKTGGYKITTCASESMARREYKVRLNQPLNDAFCTFEGGDEINIWITPRPPVYFSQEKMRGIEYLNELLLSQYSGSESGAGESGDGEEDREGDTDDVESIQDKPDEDESPDSSAVKENDREPPLENEVFDSRRMGRLYRGQLWLPDYCNKAEIKEISRDRTELLIALIGRSSPPQKGDFVSLSLYGTLTSAMRCLAARNSIQSGECGNSQLRAIIEDLETFHSEVGINKLHKLTPYVEKKIFPKYPPTPNQREAIEMALNSPDILLIQGPPGTGKTTVIAAIIESLNEMHDAQKSGCGEILVSAFQNAAVDNIVSRLSVNDLPGYKFGSRNKGDGKRRLEFDPVIFESWRSEAITKMESRYGNLKECRMQTELQQLYLKYITLPTPGYALKILNFLRDQARSSEMLKLRPRIEALQMRYQSADLAQSDDGAAYRYLVRALRTEEESFADDGVDRAYDLKLSPFARRLNDEQRDLLELAADWLPGDPLEFLPKLKSLKEELLSQFIAAPEGNSQDADDELCDLYNRCSEILEREHRSSSDESTDIIRELYLNLKNSPLLTRDALQSYTFSFAATVQKAADGRINLLRGGSPYEDVRFDTVIVDEAARANPPDLLIPMSQAVNRIILVGDHRQLPHIIEDEVLKRNEREFEQSRQQDDGAPDHRPNSFLLNPKVLRHSLFQHLWENLEKKHRTITLNFQFRMHPLMGNFVSRYFYEMQGDGGFKSGLSPQECRHGLSDDGLENKALAWFDVQGEKDKSDGSRYRKCEAVALVAKLKSWMDSEAGRGLSFGIITFYRSQVREINSALDRIGIGIPGKGEFRDEYKYLPPKEGEVARKERLQVGTVDAFQGKEFDVVLLSLVHSSAPGKKIAEDADGIKLFNRICTSEETNASKNLLCVALSRQKKLLAVFGDKRLFSSEAAKKHSFELYRLLKLSEVENNGDLGEYERPLGVRCGQPAENDEVSE